MPAAPAGQRWDPVAHEALHQIAADAGLPEYVVTDGYKLVAELAAQPSPSEDEGRRVLKARWGAQTDTQIGRARYVLDVLRADDEGPIRNVADDLEELGNHPSVVIHLAEVVYPRLRDTRGGTLLPEMNGRMATREHARRAQQRAAAQQKAVADAAEARAHAAAELAAVAQNHERWGRTDTRGGR